MTIEQLNQKLENINNRLSGVISEMYVTYDRDKLERNVNALQREILGDPRIKRILTEGTSEERTAYMDAIEKGAKAVKAQLSSLRDNDSMFAHKAELSGVFSDANKQVFDVTYSIREAEGTDFANTANSDYKKRKNDVTKKKDIVDGLLSVDEKMSDIKGALVSAGKTGSTDEIIQDIDGIENLRKDSVKALEICEKVNGVNFKNLVQKLDDLLNDPTIEMDDEEMKNAIKELKRNCYNFDAAYDIGGTSTPPLDLQGTFSSTDFKRHAQVKLWVGKLQSKVSDPAYNGILSDKTDLYEFLSEKYTSVMENFANELDSSVVLSKLASNEEIQALKMDPTKGSAILEKFKKSVENHKKYVEDKGLNRRTLELQKDELDKKSVAYTDINMDKKTLTMAGKSLSFENEMLNPNVKIGEYYKYIDYIEEQTTPEGKSFKKNFEKAVKTAIGRPRPKNKWYQRLGEIITGGLYKSPETKYAIEYDEEAVNLLKDMITEKKTRLDEATQIVGNDTEQYRKEVITATVNKKEKATSKTKEAAKKNLDAFER